MILAGEKTWEIRGSATKMRGPIALIRSKSGLGVGTCDVVDVVGPLTLRQLRASAEKAGVRVKELPYKKTYAWVLDDARPLAKSVPYRHPPGAVIWVKLDPRVIRKVKAQL